MKLLVNNVTTQALVGGVDNLLDFSPIQELREYLRVRPQGYNEVDAYKKKQWDGWRYFITEKGVFATGFLPYILDYLVDMGVQVDVIDQRGQIDPFFDDLEDKLGNGWELFDFQYESLKSLKNYLKLPNGEMMYFPRGIIDAATNAGKNSVIAAIVENLPKDKKVIMLVHTQTIFKQAVEFFGSMFHVQQVKSGKYEMGNFVIAMQKTLYNKAVASDNVKIDLQKFDVLITDESHRAGASDYSAVLQMITAPVRVLVSGTPLDNEDKVKNMITVGLSGPVLHKVTNQEVISKGKSQKPNIKIFLNEHKPPHTLMRFRDEIERYVFFSDVRNEMIRNFVQEREGNKILIAYNEIQHGEEILGWLEDLPYKVELTHSKDKQRDEKLENFKNGDTDVLIASNILKEGANIPCIRTMINAMSGKSKITVKQFIIGRSLRHDGINDEVEIIDFYDLGKYLSKHSRDRIAIYKKEGFDINFMYEANWRGKPMKYMEF